MAKEVWGAAFENPLMLQSEHKRILGDAMNRGDERCIDAERRGYHRGVAMTAWAACVVALIAALSGFSFGLSIVQ